jgi:hypothetical protein
MALLRDAAPAEGFRLQTLSFFDRLAELDAIRARPAGDSTVPDWIRKTAPLTRQIWQMEMFEITVPIPMPPKEGEYIIRFRSYPAIGREADAQTGTVHTARRLQTRGFNVGAAWQHFARDGAVVEWDFAMKRLGDWEELSGTVFADPEVQAVGRSATDLSRKPLSIDVWEVVMAAPPAK